MNRRIGEVKTERIDKNESTLEKRKFEKFSNLYRNLLTNASISIKSIEVLTEIKTEKENKVFFSYCPAFINAVFNNFWSQIVLNLNEIFRGKFCVRKFIDYTKANWNKIFTGKWKETISWSDGSIDEEIIVFNYDKIEKSLRIVENLLEDNNEIIEKIKTFRDKAIAHIDENYTAEKLAIKELRQMFTIAEQIFNIITSMYDNVHKCLEPSNADDVYNLISCVNVYDEYKDEIRKLRDKKFEEEFYKRFEK